jgi:hypothetical protein
MMSISEPASGETDYLRMIAIEGVVTAQRCTDQQDKAIASLG